MIRPPYIGVASVTSKEETKALLNMLPKSSRHLLAIGVGVTPKTLKGQSTNHAERLIPFKKVKNVFVKNSRAINLVHFSTDEPGNVFRDFIKVYSELQGIIDGVQLNIGVPDADQIEALWNLMGNDIRIIWQVRIAEPGMTFPYVHQIVRRLTPLITDILLDVSLGKGTPLTPTVISRCLTFVNVLRLSYPELGIGFAGGLSAHNVDILGPVIREISPINVDAESALRTPEDKLDLVKAADYIKATCRLFGS